MNKIILLLACLGLCLVGCTDNSTGVTTCIAGIVKKVKVAEDNIMVEFMDGRMATFANTGSYVFHKDVLNTICYHRWRKWKNIYQVKIEK